MLELTSTERQVLTNTRAGQATAFSQEGPAAHRTLRAEFIRQTLLDLDQSRPGDSNCPSGLRIVGATITGYLDLSGAGSAARPIAVMAFVNCSFDMPILLTGATLSGLSLVNCNLKQLIAHGATIHNGVDVTSCTIALDNVTLGQNAVVFGSAKIGGALKFTGSKLSPPPGSKGVRRLLELHGARVGGSVELDDCELSGGGAWLSSMTIGGDLYCSNCKIDNAGSSALTAQYATINGLVWLNEKFSSRGRVEFFGASMAAFYANRGSFENYSPDGTAIALSLEGATVARKVDMSDGFSAHGRVVLFDCRIGATLSASNASFRNKTADGLGVAIIACNASVAGAALFKNSTFEGKVDFFAARIGASLEFTGSSLDNNTNSGDGVSLYVPSAQIGGSIILNDGFKSAGVIQLSSTNVGGTVHIVKARLENPSTDGPKKVLDASNSVFSRQVMIADSSAFGPIYFSGARISDSLTIMRSTLDGRSNGPRRIALECGRMELAGSLVLGPELKAEGELFLGATRVARTLAVFGVTGQNRGGFLLNCDSVTAETMALASISGEGIVSVVGARAHRLEDNVETGWGAGKNLLLNDFEYTYFRAEEIEEPPTDIWRRLGFFLRMRLLRNPMASWKKRKAWIERQQLEINYALGGQSGMWTHISQPYRQLARVYRRSGREHEARRIEREMLRARRRSGPRLRVPDRLLFDLTFGYCLSPGRAVLSTLLVWAIGVVGVSLALQSGLFVANDPSVLCSMTNAATYALDMMVPALNLNDQQQCAIDPSLTSSPQAETAWTLGLAAYRLAGLVVLSLTVITLSGVIKPAGEAAS